MYIFKYNDCSLIRVSQLVWFASITILVQGRKSSRLVVMVQTCAIIALDGCSRVRFAVLLGCRNFCYFMLLVKVAFFFF